jgi:urea transporter
MIRHVSIGRAARPFTGKFPLIPRYHVSNPNFRPSPIPSTGCRRELGSTGNGKEYNDSKESKPEIKKPDALKARAAVFFDSSARGIGQVIFLNSQTSGLVLLGGLALGSPYLATLAALGTVTATATSHAAGLDTSSIKDGLLGYNGCLVGCAAAVFGPASVLAATASTIVGAAATPFVAASLKETISIPQWTYAFNIVALTSLLRTRPFLVPESVSDDTLEQLASTVTATNSTVTDVLVGPMTGISQIFVVDSALSGAVIVGGIANYSPMLAAHALGGSCVGMLVGASLGAPLSDLSMGLWGYNSALTSMAVGVFFVHSAPAIALSAGGAAATASLFGAMKTIFGAYGAPCLTLPFCFTMSACYLLQKQIPGLVFAKNPHSPEKNSASQKPDEVRKD